MLPDTEWSLVSLTPVSDVPGGHSRIDVRTTSKPSAVDQRTVPTCARRKLTDYAVLVSIWCGSRAPSSPIMPR